MSGELRLSQFRWTTTADDDLVIGAPGASNTPKYIVSKYLNNYNGFFRYCVHLKSEI